MRSTIKLTVFATLTAFAIGASGCNGAATGNMMPTPNGPADPGPADPNNPDFPGQPSNPQPPAPVANYSGVYEVVSPVDFTQTGVLPGVWGPALAGLSQLHDNPGKAILTIVEGAGIPYLSSILMKVPSFLKNALSGLLDDLIIDNVYKGYPVVDQIASIIQGITEVTKKIEFYDEITVKNPAVAGAVQIEQQMSGLGFTLLGKKQIVDFSNAAKALSLSKMGGTLTPHAVAPQADADLTIGAGTFKIPVGEALLSALGPLLFSQFGGAQNLKDALLNLVPCMSFGQTISDGLGGVISVADAQSFCQGALGLIANQVESRIKAVTFDNVVVDGAKGKLFDTSMMKPTMDHQSDRLAEGTWSFKFTVGSGSVTVPSTFAGDRIGNAP
jgi:hypothetical protein